MKINKHIKDIALFLAILFGLIAISSYIIKPKGYDAYDLSVVKLKTEIIKAETDDSLDVIFAGNSETSYAFSPMQLWKEQGITSYGLGSGAQRLCDTYAILCEAFKTQSPKLLVLETDSLMEEFPGVEKDDDKFTNALEKALPIFHYHGAYNQIQLPEFILKHTQNRKNEGVYRGFIVEQGVNGITPYDYMSEDNAPSCENISDEGISLLEKIKKLCENNDCELMLVSSPSVINWNLAKHNAVAEWAGNAGVEYIDLNLCNEEIGIDWTEDTFDGGVHININGADKVNAYFGSILKKKLEIRVGGDFSVLTKNQELADEWNDDFNNSYYSEKD